MTRRQLLITTTFAALVLPLTGCDMLKDAQAIREDVKKELGVEANVNVNVTNGVKNVTVKLSSTPKGDAADIKKKVEKIVKRHMGDGAIVKLEM